VPPTTPVPVVDPTQAFPTAPPVQPGYPPAGPPPGPPGQPPAGGGGGGGGKGPIIGLALLVVAALLVGSFVLFGGDDDNGGGDAGGDQLLLEPIGLTLADDFAGNLDLDTPGDSLALALPDVPPIEEDDDSLSGNSLPAEEPGLYGGSRDVGVCDVDQLIEFLTDEDNIDKAEAWAEVQGIDVDGIEDFILDLTPVRLRFDTRVTNHGFRDGRATPTQSILERGTAVLVDDRGVPRVKCNCGNPLDEPVDLGGEDYGDDDLYSNPDNQWDAFDPQTIIIIIEADDEIDDFILIDVNTGEVFKRPAGTNGDGDDDPPFDDDAIIAICELADAPPNCQGGGDGTTTTTAGDTTTTTDAGGDTTTTTIELGTGDVQVTLQWNSPADLDLAVTDPTGETIDFGNTGPTATGGQLDVDSNVGCEDTGSVENVFWPPGQAPVGAYTATVTGFSTSCGSGAFTLTVRIAGQDDQVFQGDVSDGGSQSFDFVV
jgi:hypothetical protein